MIVLTPTFLLDADPLPQASPPARSDHSIEDIIALFPSPPMHELDFEPNLHSSTKECRSSLSTSGSFLSVTSVETAATSPPTTPELDQMTRMTSASKGAGIFAELLKSQRCWPSQIESPLESVESAGAVFLQTNRSRNQATLDRYSAYAPSCCTQAAPTGPSVPCLSFWDNGQKKLDSITPSDHLLQEGDIVSANATEGLAFSATQDCLSSVVTSKGEEGNSETSLTAIAPADSEPMQKVTSFCSMKHVLHAFRNANGEDRVREEWCFPGNSPFTALQCLNAPTPLTSTGRVQVAPSCSEGLTTWNSIGGTSHMNRSPAPFYTHGLSSCLGPNIDIHGPCVDQDYGDTIESFEVQTCNTGNNSTLLI